MTLTTKLRPLAWAAYAVAFLLIVVPLVEVVLGVWPMRIGQVNWRFGAAGLMSQSVMTPLLGLLLALVTAAAVGHRVMARALAILALAGGVLGMLAIAMFSLDSLQARSSVRPDALTSFDRAAIVAVGRYLLGTGTAFLLGVGGWKASRKDSGVAGSPVEAPKAKGTEGGSRVLVSASDR